MNKKKPHFTWDFNCWYIFNMLQQSRTSLKKEVKKESVKKILINHGSLKLVLMYELYLKITFLHNYFSICV